MYCELCWTRANERVVARKVLGTQSYLSKSELRAVVLPYQWVLLRDLKVSKKRSTSTNKGVSEEHLSMPL